MQDTSAWQVDTGKDSYRKVKGHLPLLGNISAQNHKLCPYSNRILACVKASHLPTQTETDEQTGRQTDRWTDGCLRQQQYPLMSGKNLAIIHNYLSDGPAFLLINVEFGKNCSRPVNTTNQYLSSKLYMCTESRTFPSWKKFVLNSRASNSI